MRTLLLAGLLAWPLLADVDGTVTNRTSGKPQAGVTLALTKIGQGGMESAGSATSGADGRFHFKADGQAMYLVQATWQGVTYNVQVAPGAPSDAVQVAVNDVSAKQGAAAVAQHMLLVEADDKDFIVSETVIFDNPSQVTWYDPKAGTLRFSVPAEAGTNVQARAIAPGGMSVDREPQKTAEKGVFTLDFPVKPGETRFDISYKLAMKQPMVFAGRILHAGPTRLVVPQGMTAEAANLTSLGNEPSTKAAIYDIKGESYQIKLSGSGALRSQQPAAAAGAAQEQEEEGPRIVQIQPPGYDRVWRWALGMMLAILGLAFAAHYMKAAPAGRPRR